MYVIKKYLVKKIHTINEIILKTEFVLKNLNYKNIPDVIIKKFPSINPTIDDFIKYFISLKYLLS